VHISRAAAIESCVEQSAHSSAQTGINQSRVNPIGHGNCTRNLRQRPLSDAVQLSVHFTRMRMHRIEGFRSSARSLEKKMHWRRGPHSPGVCLARGCHSAKGRRRADIKNSMPRLHLEHLLAPEIASLCECGARLISSNSHRFERIVADDPASRTHGV
jgi:hypothetical protein